jgi:hypothetical protein
MRILNKIPGNANWVSIINYAKADTISRTAQYEYSSTQKICDPKMILNLSNLLWHN